MRNVLKFSIFLTLLLCLSTIARGQEILVFESPKYLKCNDTVRVYTPEDGNVRATLILLHGRSGCYRNWGDIMDIQKYCNKSGFRIINPDGFFNSWYVNNTDTSRMQCRDFYNKELIPALFEKYNLSPETTFIDGLSMGGHGAVNLFIDNIDLFRAAGSMSGTLNLAYSNLEEDMEEVFGEKIVERKVAESAVTNVEKIVGTDKIILISCGYSDYYVICSEEFAKKCKEIGVPVVESYSPGDHSWQFWEFALDQHLWYFQRILNGEEMGYR